MVEIKNNQELRKQELKDKVHRISQMIKDEKIEEKLEAKPHSMEEAEAQIERTIYVSNIKQLKEYLIDRNCEGERPKLIISSPHTRPETGETDDVWYMPKESKYNQEILDFLKKQQLIPEYSTTDEYNFLLR